MFSISFKIFQRFNIDSHQAIFFNYMTAFILGVLFSLNGEMVVNPIKADWFIPVILLGLIFMAGMVVLSDSTRRVGVAISTVCSYSFFKKDPDGKRVPVTFKNILGGASLGLINYGCTYTLMLSMKTIDSSLLFPIHNIGIVAIGAIVGWLAYGEKLKPHQVFGIILAAASIALLCI